MPPAFSDASRRAVRRAVDLVCDVVGQWWDPLVPHVAKDLSPYGMWLETPCPAEVGTRLTVSFVPPRLETPIVCTGAVRWVEYAMAFGGRRTGMGIEFVHVAEEDREALHRALKGLPPPLPGGADPAALH